MYSTIPYLASNRISIITPGCQYIPMIYNRLLFEFLPNLTSRKMRSDITTYSYSELASLLINNEQVRLSSSVYLRCNSLHPMSFLFTQEIQHGLQRLRRSFLLYSTNAKNAIFPWIRTLNIFIMYVCWRSMSVGSE